MLYPTETLDLLPPVEQIDAHLKHQKGIFRPRAAEFLKKKAERKVRKTACLSHFSDFRVWQGQKDSNPRHAVLETAALPTELYPYLLFKIAILL